MEKIWNFCYTISYRVQNRVFVRVKRIENVWQTKGGDCRGFTKDKTMGYEQRSTL